jgi:WD40 repeat protein
MFAVYGVAWAPDAESFVLVGYEEKDNWGIYLYSIDTLEQRWSGTTPNIDQVAFSPDGKFIVSASGGLALWDAVTGESIRDEWFQTHSLVLVKFLPNGQEIITGISSPDSQVTLVHKWDLRTFQSSDIFNHEGWLVDLELSTDGRILATGLLNEWGQVILWDIQTEEQLCRFDNGVSVALNPAKDIVAVYHSEEKVILWDVKTCGFLKEIDEKINDYTLIFSSDGEMLAFGSLDEDEGLQIWDSETGTKLHTIKLDNIVLLLSFSPNDRYLLSVSRDDANGVIVDLWGVRP